MIKARLLLIFFSILCILHMPISATAEIAEQIKIQEVISPKGIKAWLVEDHTLPILTMNFGLEAGSRYDQNGKEGTEKLFLSMLIEGAGPYNTEQFDAVLQDKAINLSFNSSEDYLVGMFRTTIEHKKEALQVLKEVLYHPRFGQEEFNKVKSRYLAHLPNLRKRPEFIANKALDNVVFGSHPYHRDESGSETSIKRITLEDIKNFGKQNLTRDRLMVGVCGAITARELAVLLDDVFGELPIENPHKEKFQPAQLNIDGSLQIIESPHPQSTVVFSQKGLPITDKNFRKVQVLLQILGDGLPSRLLQEIRVKRGLIYTLSLGSQNYQLADLISGQMASDNAHVAEAIKVLKEEWAKIRDKGITSQELEDAKTNLIGGYPLNFTSSGSIAGVLQSYLLYGFDKDYIVRREKEIRSLNLEEVNAFAKEFFKPEGLTFVVVGKPQDLTSLKGHQ